MYQRILLAYDGTLEGRSALREGAVLAMHCGAKVYLLSVVAETAGIQMAEGAHSGPIALRQELYKTVLDEGTERLRALGLDPVAHLVSGEPARVIGAYAREIGADLVVVGHRRQNALTRWWSGSSGAYLVDHVGCSLLISRNQVSDAAIALPASMARAAVRSSKSASGRLRPPTKIGYGGSGKRG